MPLPASPHEQSVARAVALFALTGALAVVLLGFAAVQVLKDTGEKEAVRDAKEITDLAGRAAVAPNVEPGLFTGDAAARRRIGDAVRDFVLGDPVVRVKLWDRDGTIVWSDEPRLVGQRYALGREEVEALDEGSVDAEVSDLDEPENRYERGFGRMLEVYRGIRAPTGERLLFETYQRSAVIEAQGRDLWEKFLPALFGALIGLLLVQIPLAYLLARRLRERQRERSLLLERAVDASEGERRAIAASLHDGPVQQLAGVAFSLAATAKRLDGQDGQGVRPTLEDAAARTRTTMRDLRSMLVDLYPATLHRSGLQAAITDLLGPLREAGMAVDCSVPAALALPERQEALLFRGAREALQNVRKHASAAHVTVRVVSKPGGAVLTVSDDGEGFDLVADAARGHFGLKLLGDLAAEGGGRLDIDTAAGQGTTVRLEVSA